MEPEFISRSAITWGTNPWATSLLLPRAPHTIFWSFIFYLSNFSLQSRFFRPQANITLRVTHILFGTITIIIKHLFLDKDSPQNIGA